MVYSFLSDGPRVAACRPTFGDCAHGSHGRLVDRTDRDADIVDESRGGGLDHRRWIFARKRACRVSGDRLAACLRRICR